MESRSRRAGARDGGLSVGASPTARGSRRRARRSVWVIGRRRSWRGSTAPHAAGGGTPDTSAVTSTGTSLNPLAGPESERSDQGPGHLGGGPGCHRLRRRPASCAAATASSRRTAVVEAGAASGFEPFGDGPSSAAAPVAAGRSGRRRGGVGGSSSETWMLLRTSSCALRSSRRPLPIDRPSSGRRAGPTTSKATTRTSNRFLGTCSALDSPGFGDRFTADTSRARPGEGQGSRRTTREREPARAPSFGSRTRSASHAWNSRAPARARGVRMRAMRTETIAMRDEDDEGHRGRDGHAVG